MIYTGSPVLYTDLYWVGAKLEGAPRTSHPPRPTLPGTATSQAKMIMTMTMMMMMMTMMTMMTMPDQIES